MNRPNELMGMTYQSPNGHWSWTINQNGLNIVGGTGYNTQEEADEDMQTELTEQKQRI